MCNSSSCNPYSLCKGLLIENRWCLTSTSWTTSTSPPSTCHLHMSNDNKIHLISILVYLVVLVPTTNILNHHEMTRFFFVVVLIANHSFHLFQLIFMFIQFSKPLRLYFLTLVFHIQFIMYIFHIIQSHMLSTNMHATHINPSNAQ